jgi:hypothetical protein
VSLSDLCGKIKKIESRYTNHRGHRDHREKPEQKLGTRLCGVILLKNCHKNVPIIEKLEDSVSGGQHRPV